MSDPAPKITDEQASVVSGAHRTDIDVAVARVYGALLYHHLNAFRASDAERTARVFQMVEDLRWLWPEPCDAWEAFYDPERRT